MEADRVRGTLTETPQAMSQLAAVKRGGGKSGEGGGRRGEGSGESESETADSKGENTQGRHAGRGERKEVVVKWQN